MLQDHAFQTAERKVARWRELVESAGAIWVGVQYGSKHGSVILFQSAPGESTLALYASALNSKADVELAIKNYEDAKRMVRVDGL